MPSAAGHVRGSPLKAPRPHLAPKRQALLLEQSAGLQGARTARADNDDLEAVRKDLRSLFGFSAEPKSAPPSPGRHVGRDPRTAAEAEWEAAASLRAAQREAHGLQSYGQLETEQQAASSDPSHSIDRPQPVRVRPGSVAPEVADGSPAGLPCGHISGFGKKAVAEVRKEGTMADGTPRVSRKPVPGTLKQASSAGLLPGQANADGGSGAETPREDFWVGHAGLPSWHESRPSSARAHHSPGPTTAQRLCFSAPSTPREETVERSGIRTFRTAPGKDMEEIFKSFAGLGTWELQDRGPSVRLLKVPQSQSHLRGGRFGDEEPTVLARCESFDSFFEGSAGSRSWARRPERVGEQASASASPPLAEGLAVGRAGQRRVSNGEATEGAGFGALKRQFHAAPARKANVDTLIFGRRVGGREQEGSEAEEYYSLFGDRAGDRSWRRPLLQGDIFRGVRVIKGVTAGEPHLLVPQLQEGPGPERYRPSRRTLVAPGASTEARPPWIHESQSHAAAQATKTEQGPQGACTGHGTAAWLERSGSLGSIAPQKGSAGLPCTRDESARWIRASAGLRTGRETCDPWWL